MNTNQKISTPQESLLIIEQAIRETKNNWKEHSDYYLIWGWGISFACLLQYGLIKMNFESISFYHWPVIIIICIALTIWKSKKMKEESSRTHQYDALGKLWMVLGLCYAMMGFLAGSLNISPCILSLFIAGIGTMTSGMIMRYNPLTIGGIVLFIGCIACTFVSQIDTLLINAISLILGYLVPAYMLKNTEI